MRDDIGIAVVSQEVTLTVLSEHLAVDNLAADVGRIGVVPLEGVVAVAYGEMAVEYFASWPGAARGVGIAACGLLIIDYGVGSCRAVGEHAAYAAFAVVVLLKVNLSRGSDTCKVSLHYFDRAFGSRQGIEGLVGGYSDGSDWNLFGSDRVGHLR